MSKNNFHRWVICRVIFLTCDANVVVFYNSILKLRVVLLVEERWSEAEGVCDGWRWSLVWRRRRGRIRSPAETDSGKKRLHGFMDHHHHIWTSSTLQDHVGGRSSFTYLSDSLFSILHSVLQHRPCRLPSRSYHFAGHVCPFIDVFYHPSLLCLHSRWSQTHLFQNFSNHRLHVYLTKCIHEIMDLWTSHWHLRRFYLSHFVNFCHLTRRY